MGTLSTASPFKPYLGQVGFHPILYEFFSGVYLGLSGPLASVYNPVGHPFKSYLDQNKKLSFLHPSNSQSFQTLSGPSGFLSHPTHLSFWGLFGPVWTFGLCIQSCWASFEKLFGPKKKLGQLHPFNNQSFQTLSGPSRFLSHPIRMSFWGLFGPICAKWVCIEWQWASLGK